MSEANPTYHVRIDRPLMGADPAQPAPGLTCDLRPMGLESVAEVAAGVHAYVRLVATFAGQDPDTEVFLVSPAGVMFEGAVPQIYRPGTGQPGFDSDVPIDGSWCVSWEAGPTYWANHRRPLGLVLPDWCGSSVGVWPFQLLMYPTNRQ